MAKPTLDDMLLTLSDEARADVLKMQIKEVEATKRNDVDAKEQTKRVWMNSDGVHLVRALGWAAVIIIALCATCVGYKGVESWEAVEKVRSGQPAASTSAR